MQDTIEVALRASPADAANAPELRLEDVIVVIGHRLEIVGVGARSTPVTACTNNS